MGDLHTGWFLTISIALGVFNAYTANKVNDMGEHDIEDWFSFPIFINFIMSCVYLILLLSYLAAENVPYGTLTAWALLINAATMLPTFWGIYLGFGDCLLNKLKTLTTFVSRSI